MQSRHKAKYYNFFMFTLMGDLYSDKPKALYIKAFGSVFLIDCSYLIERYKQ